jgi:UDP-N-acetyl-D-glucosamine dehydrogenase
MTVNYYEILIQKLQERTARVAIIGLGYVGLPLAVVFAEKGFTVIGVDTDRRKVDTVNRGESHIQDVPAAQVKSLVDAGKLSATTDFTALQEADAACICVPTPLGKFGDPDMSYVIAATESLAKHIHPGMVVVLESTTYPGTTREILLPKLGSEKGLTVGQDFFLAFSPERVDPGRKDWTTINTPKVMGGITEACSQVATIWYSQALKTIVPVTSAEGTAFPSILCTCRGSLRR